MTAIQDILQVNGHVQDDIQEREPRVPIPAADAPVPQPGTMARSPRSAGRAACRSPGRSPGAAAPGATSTTTAAPISSSPPTTALPSSGATRHRLRGPLADAEAGGHAQQPERHRRHRPRRRPAASPGAPWSAAAPATFPRATCGPTSAWAPHETADVEITWPSGTVDRIAGVPADRIRTVREGAGLAP